MTETKIAAQAAAAIILAYWTGMSASAKLLIILVCADYVTGFISAFVRKELSSDAGFRGLGKKVLTLIAVWVTHQISAPLQFGFDIGAALALFYCANEGISIFENLAKAGVPVPTWIVDALARLNSKEPRPTHDIR